jgi:hypothetical protein
MVLCCSSFVALSPSQLAPVTYRILVSCCTTATGATAIFEDMQKAEMLISAPIYQALLSLVAGDARHTRAVLDHMATYSLHLTDIVGAMKGPEALALAQAIVQSGIPLGV